MTYKIQFFPSKTRWMSLKKYQPVTSVVLCTNQSVNTYYSITTVINKTSYDFKILFYVNHSLFEIKIFFTFTIINQMRN